MTLLFGASLLVAVLALFALAFYAYRRPNAGAWTELESPVTAIGILLTTALAFGAGNIATSLDDIPAQLAEAGWPALLTFALAVPAAVILSARLISRGRRNARLVTATTPAGDVTPPPAANDDAAPSVRAA